MKQQEIEKLAATTLLNSQVKLQFPIDLEALLSFLKIDICKDNLEGEAGYILHKNDNFRIIIDNTESHSPAFLRFTIAHEIAHVILGHLTSRKYIPYWLKEYEANCLASAILMPFHFMIAYRNIETRILSCFMAVSENAMKVRRETIKKDPNYYLAIEKDLYKENLLRDFNSGTEEMI